MASYKFNGPDCITVWLTCVCWECDRRTPNIKMNWLNPVDLMPIHCLYIHITYTTFASQFIHSIAHSLAHSLGHLFIFSACLLARLPILAFWIVRLGKFEKVLSLVKCIELIVGESDSHSIHATWHMMIVMMMMMLKAF